MSYCAVSLSGGKDSTAMLLMMLERGEQIDEVIFFDTGKEFPEMYEHIDRLETDTGLRFTRLGMDFDWLMFDKPIKSKYGGSGYGWPRANARWCTACKQATIESVLRYRADVVSCVGIAADETHRVRDKRYPLVELGVTESDALSYCYERGYTWGGLYEHFHRVSCWCCPLKSLDECRALRKFHPELWSELMQMDERARNDYRNDYTVKQLEERFAFEDRQDVLPI